MRALNTKVLRDLYRMRGQLLPIALILAAGIGVFVGVRSTAHSLATAHSSYYAAERFAHVFASLVRAPERVAEKLRAIPGVQRVETRVIADVTLDVPGLPEAATGRLVSIPEHGLPGVNGIHLVSGSWPRSGAGTSQVKEVLVGEAFQGAHGFSPGAMIKAVINGHSQRLRIVGVALSPEFTYVVAKSPRSSWGNSDYSWSSLLHWACYSAIGSEVGNLSRIEIVADFLSQDAVLVRPGMRVENSGWGEAEKELAANVRRMEPGGFTKISALGDGFRVDLRIIPSEVKGALIVPTGALLRIDQEWGVFVITNGHAHERRVQIGQRNGLEAEVLGGLREGERVVLYPSELICALGLLKLGFLSSGD